MDEIPSFHLIENQFQKSITPDIGCDLHIHLFSSFQNAENINLSRCTPSTLSSSSPAEVPVHPFQSPRRIRLHSKSIMNNVLVIREWMF